MSSGPLLPTFRDPAGSLRLEGDSAIRTIHPAAREAVLEFVASAFSQRLQLHGDMIGTIVEDRGADGLQLVHPRVAVPSYAWEWTPSQWLAAAELTLRLCREALEEGWILKDATPLNILFVGAKPVLVDVLSFERRKPGIAIWLAYGQYVRTFLLPLLMNKLQGWPLSLSLFRRDGLEPGELYAAMSWRQRLSPAAFWPITLPAWLEKRKGADTARPAERLLVAGAATHVLKRTMESLSKRTQRAVSKVTRSEWSEYQSTLTHYTAEESAAKMAWVESALDEAQPKRVLDVGANTGDYSAMVAQMGAQVVALERDGAAADRLFRMSRDRGLNVLTLHADLARPTPAAGWENAEQSALLSRLEGQFEMVMLLAVIHHLILMEQIPLDKIMALCARLTKRHLIVEWVPVSDPMYQSLMRGRDELYGALTEADLVTAAAAYFHPVRQQTLGNGRVLFLMELLPGKN
jgi:2-polyprenyl-3-methyl-5-hydroxy-6-metoxy-1,4-benzoquinol methylase